MGRSPLALAAVLLVFSTHTLSADVRTDQKTHIEFGGTLGRVVNFFGGNSKTVDLENLQSDKGAYNGWNAYGQTKVCIGLLTTELSWRYVLFINVPIGVALLTAAAASLMPSPPGRDWARLDLPGALTVTVGAGSLVYAVSQATIRGWGSTPVIAALAAAAVLLAAFGMIEARSAAPLVPLSILRRRSLAATRSGWG